MATSIAYAGDCRNVTFTFDNNTGVEIRLESVVIVGNDGTWTENIWNHRMDANDPPYSTNGRRMNGLDSGQAPASMTVEYDRRVNGVWVQDSQRFTSLPVCDDGDEYFLVLN